MKDPATAGFPSVPLSDVATVVNGGTPKSKVAEYWGGDIQWLTPKDMGQMEGREISETPRTITQAGLKGSSARLVPAGSVILSTRAPIGHLAMNTVPMAFNQGCRGIIPSEKLDPVYLYHFLNMSRVLLNELGSGTTFKELSSTNLKSVKIPLPSLEEQQRIVAFLDEAFEGLARARAHAESNLQNARNLFETILSAFIDRHKEHWTSTTLGEAYDVRDGTHDSPKYHPTGRALITSKNLGRDGLHFEKVKFISEEDYDSIRRRSGVDRGDVLFAMIGTIGNPIVVDIDPDFAIKNVALFKMRGGRSGKFLRYILRSRYVVEKMQAEAKGTTQQFVGLGYLRSFPVILPEPTAERALVDELDSIEAQCRLVEEEYAIKLQDLEELRQSLLQRAFAGDLTPLETA